MDWIAYGSIALDPREHDADGMCEWKKFASSSFFWVVASIRF
jgi:hypothetical protein